MDCKMSEILNHLLTTAIVLKIADSKKEFVVCTDVCQEEVEWVLMQEGKVISYESWKLK